MSNDVNKKIIYFTYRENCKYCDKFKDAADELYRLYGDENFIRMECENLDIKNIAKKIFGVKTVPSLVVVENKKFKLLQDISSLSLDEVNELIIS